MKHLIVLTLSLAGATYAFGHCGSCESDMAADHKHDKAAAKQASSMECCEEGCGELVTTYEKVSMALAADDLKSAKAAAEELSCYASCHEETRLGNEVAKIAKASSIEDARKAFKAVSSEVIAKAEGTDDYFVMTCPMAKADWIQTSKEVANPYFGSQMLRCGSVKKTVTAKL